MFVHARRQLLSPPLHDRAQHPEADQLVHAESARLAERTRIAREMHDVLAHRISLVALHAGALEVALDLPPAQVRESAALLRLTAHQALEELRDVIGVLRRSRGRSGRRRCRNRRWRTFRGWWRRLAVPGQRSISRCGWTVQLRCLALWVVTPIASCRKR